MCRRTFLFGVTGFVFGLLVLAAATFYGMAHLLVVESESPLGFQETIQSITTAANEQGWQVPKVYKLCQGLAKHGYQVRPVAVIELCKPDYAAELLSHDATRMVSSFMPCRISVYQTADGRVIISRMNTALMSRLFPQEVAGVMALATRETGSILGRALDTSPRIAGR